MKKGKAFSLVEVVVALAMFALIAVPAIGLATMAIGQSRDSVAAGDAASLKNRIDVAYRGTIVSAASFFTTGYVPVNLVASEDLLYIEPDGSASTENDQHYGVNVTAPQGYVFSTGDPYRIVLFEVYWPKSAAAEDQKRVYYTSVFRK